MKAMKNRKTYIKPAAKAEYTESNSAFAASQKGIAMGGEIGKGDHSIPGGAKMNNIVWKYEDYNNDNYWGNIWEDDEDE